MSERLNWTPENPEQEPFIKLGVGGGEDKQEYYLTRQNSRLIKHLGRLSVYDHVYFQQVEDNEVKESFYMFDYTPGYEQVQQFMLERNYPASLNETFVSSVDQDAYINGVTRSMPDTVPEEWQTNPEGESDPQPEE